MLPNHGFSFEMEDLLKEVFQYLILENALLPPSQRLHLWESRLAAGDTGFCLAQEINFDETVCDEAISSEICKPGREAGEFERNGIKVNTQNFAQYSFLGRPPPQRRLTRDPPRTNSENEQDSRNFAGRPDKQNMLDVFKGKWICEVPVEGGLSTGGEVAF